MGGLTRQDWHVLRSEKAGLARGAILVKMSLTNFIDKPTESLRIRQLRRAAMQRRQSHRMFSLERLVAALALISWLSFAIAGEQHVIHPLEPSLLSGASWPTDSALDSLFSRARVVLIGESIHGTAQFPQLREALSRYLARRFAFRILALEGPYASCLNPITSAIAREAFVTEVRRCIPSNWYTEESVGALWHLIADPSGPRMKIYGFDIQPTELLSAPEYAALVEGAVSRPAPDSFATDVASVFRTIHEHLWEKVDGVGYLTSNSARLNQELERLAKEAGSRKASTPRAARQILASEIRFLTYWQAVESGHWRNFMVLRDRGMADNLASIVTAHPSEKILVWAHNGHVALSHQDESDAPTPSMGELMRARFGPSVVSVAMVMGKGSVDRRKGQTIDVPAPSKGVVESLLMSYPIAFVLPKQLCRMDPILSVGHFAMRDNGTIAVQYNCDPSAFDALFFVRDASPPKYLY